MAVIIFISDLWDFVTNPVILENQGNILYIKNKNSKTLWTKVMGFDVNKQSYKSYPNISQLTVDIDNDGINEIIFANESFSSTEEIIENTGRIACFNNSAKLLWEYKFSEKVSTTNETHTSRYISNLIDTVSENGKLILYVFADNAPNFPSSIYKLDILTGRRVEGTLWHSGHVQRGVIGDFNEDGEKELVMLGINNGLERCVLFSIDLNKINGQAPTAANYKFLDFAAANFNEYLILPKTDYNQIIGLRFNSTLRGDLGEDINSGGFVFYTIEDRNEVYRAGIGYRIDRRLLDLQIDISDVFQVKRDSLVSKGKLSLPYTNTPEYRQILKNQIRYWDGEKFTRR